MSDAPNQVYPPIDREKRACVFAHFDRDDVVDEYVLFYLNQLLSVAKHIVFVSTASLPESEIAKVESLGVKAIVRENVGYDFYSYKVGLDNLVLEAYEELILCNDSVYGPFYPVVDLFEKDAISQCDFWGVTDNYEINYHLQSYFLVFRRVAFFCDAFRRFWAELEILEDKLEIIRRYEIGLSQRLLQAELVAKSVYPVDKINPLRFYILWLIQFVKKKSHRVFTIEFYKNLFKNLMGLKAAATLRVNTTHEDWRHLLESGSSPFVKIELLRDNPCNIDGVENIYDIIDECFDYPVDLIKHHLQRVR